MLAHTSLRLNVNRERIRDEYSFKVGDLIKLSTKDTPIEKGPAYKLKPRYVGPLEVLKVVSPVPYRITLPEKRMNEAHSQCDPYLSLAPLA